MLNESLAWVEENAPHFECSDEDVTLTYWYRWRLFHLHMRRGDKLQLLYEDCWWDVQFDEVVLGQGGKGGQGAQGGEGVEGAQAEVRVVHCCLCL